MGAQARSRSLRELVRHGYVAPIWCDGREILRRIFVTVRDRQWREVGPARFEYAVDEAAGTVSFNARHTSEEVDFEWRGVLKVSDGFRKVSFAMEGKALRDMEVCRVGLVVLHPVEAMVGSQVSALGANGEQRLTVPRLISPQPILDGVPQAMTEPFSGLNIERPDFGRLELRFSGELFELEDQRNWGDTSFKTYCTPLRVRFPRKLAAGSLVSHRLEARFAPAERRVQSVDTEQPGAPRRVFPTIRRESPLLEASDPTQMAALRRLLASPSSTKVELRVEAGTDQGFPPDLLALLSRSGERIKHLLIYGPGNALPSAEVIGRLRRQLDVSGLLNFPLVAATRGYFVELNREPKFSAPVTGVAFPLTATVHGDDPETITENVTVPVDIAETARHLTGVLEIVISPLGLYHPRAANPTRFPKVLVRPWLTATLVYAAVAGVTAITLATDLLEALGSNGDGFLSELLEYAERDVAPVGLPLPAGVHALTFVSKEGRPVRMLVANLASGAASLMLDKHEIEIPGYGTTWIELS